MSKPVASVLKIMSDALDTLGQDSDCCALNPEVCRTAVYLGGEVPWDSCDSGCAGGKNGMLWAQLVRIDPVTGDPGAGNCASFAWTIEFGIVRCVAGPDQSGNPPSETAVAADAAQQIADADAIFAALSCCASRSDALRDATVSSWTPLGPDGGCAGGTWSMRGRLNVCC